MIEKVNPSHPDKVADRIAGTMLDLAYDELDNSTDAIADDIRFVEYACRYWLLFEYQATAL